MKEPSLREKKHARTRIAIVEAFMERLKDNRFDDIPIKSVCADVEVAEGTFFNYFPEKIDVIAYHLSMTTVKMVWRAGKEVPAGKFLPLIDNFFQQISRELNNNNLIYQIISALLTQNERPKKITLSALEKKLAFPDCAGIEEISTWSLEEWFKECVIRAQKNGELSAKVKVDDVVVSLMTIITGTLLAIRFSNGNSRNYHYMRQLRDLWRICGANLQGKELGYEIQ